MSKNYVATNQEYLNAYNEYLQEHSITEAQATGFINLGTYSVPINKEMFFDFLLNKIALQVISNHAFSDKLDSLYSGEMRVGEYIEDIRTVLKGEHEQYDVENFEANITNPFTKKKSKLSTVYHKVNARKKLKVTTSLEQIESAFLTPYGVSSLVNTIINDQRVQYAGWAFRDKRKALEQPAYARRVSFTDYSDFAIKLKDIVDDFEDYDNSYKYNASLLYSPMDLKDVVIVLSKKFKNEIDINYFTGLFNVSYAELKKSVIEIKEFTDPNIVCGIYDKRGIQFKKVLDETRKLQNGEDLTENTFIHFWRMHSVSPHYNAVVLVKQTEGVFDGEYAITSDSSYTIDIPEGTNIIYTTNGDEPSETSGTLVLGGNSITLTETSNLRHISVVVDENGDYVSTIPNSERYTRVKFVAPVSEE